MTTRFLLIALLGAISLEAQQSLSPAQISIQRAQEQIAKHPDHYPYYNDLAMAYARRARETSDVAWYGKAEETLKKSFAAAPDNFEGQKVMTWLLLGRHEFAKARESAVRLNQRTPDDVTVYGYLADANAELGNYDEAVTATQWMLNLRPGNIAGLTRAAYLRELHGEISGAAELMQMAYDATPYQQTEDRAWLLTQLAHLNLVAADLPAAERFASGALSLFPNYHYALGAQGQIRLTQKRYEEAAALFQRRYESAPHAENLFALAEALHLAGRKADAEKAFGQFEHLSLKESSLADNSNHELMAYYTDYAGKPGEALKIARQELGRRHDVFTRDSYAWALAASGDYAGADAEMRKALAVGVKDPKILAHANAIGQHLQGAKSEEQRLRAAATVPANVGN